MAPGTSTIISDEGDIAYRAGTNIKSEILATNAGDIALTANSSILAANAITTKLGKVDLTAQTGSITTEGDAPISAKGRVADTDAELADVDGDITLTAKTDITIGTPESTDDGVSTEVGNIKVEPFRFRKWT